MKTLSSAALFGGETWLWFGLIYGATTVTVNTIARAVTLKAVPVHLLPIQNYILHDLTLGLILGLIPAIINTIRKIRDVRQTTRQ